MVVERDPHGDEGHPSGEDPPRLGRTIATGSVIGVVVTLVGATAALRLSGIEWGGALGFGSFVAFWGGLGFGSMMGGVAWATQLFHPTAPPAAGGDDPDADDPAHRAT